jgi:hypothetical protein
MEKLFITTLATICFVGYSQAQMQVADTNRNITMLVTAREQKGIEADRIRQLQIAAIREIQKVTDTNKLVRITSDVIAAQTNSAVMILSR